MIKRINQSVVFFFVFVTMSHAEVSPIHLRPAPLWKAEITNNTCSAIYCSAGQDKDDEGSPCLNAEPKTVTISTRSTGHLVMPGSDCGVHESRWDKTPTDVKFICAPSTSTPFHCKVTETTCHYTDEYKGPWMCDSRHLDPHAVMHQKIVCEKTGACPGE